jgi:uncharacterized Zn-finger protein
LKDTGSRPYACKECKRPFARQDALARHEKLHNRKESIQFTASPPDFVSKQVTPSASPISELNIKRISPPTLGLQAPLTTEVLQLVLFHLEGVIALCMMLAKW